MMEEQMKRFSANIRGMSGMWGLLLAFGLAVGCSPAPGPSGPQCGGIAGLECPGAGQCVDDPADSCDPSQGGADCGGICTCDVIGACALGEIWDDSPEVCACAPQQTTCAAVTCLVGTVCVEFPDGTAGCVSRDPCAGFACPAGSRCIAPADAPYCIADEGEACGAVTCSEGMVCCNSSCGICTPPDWACTQQACPLTE